jgi:hypothetical protein
MRRVDCSRALSNVESYEAGREDERRGLLKGELDREVLDREVELVGGDAEGVIKGVLDVDPGVWRSTVMTERGGGKAYFDHMIDRFQYFKLAS